jgi:hypothetical protein
MRKRERTYTPFGGFAFVDVEVDVREFGPEEGAVPELEVGDG